MRGEDTETPPHTPQPERPAETPSFEQLFERYYRPIFSFFANRGFSAEESRDLTQDTFLSVYKGMATFRHDATVQTWVFKIAGNIWRNALRSRAAIKRKATELSLDHLLNEGLVHSASANPLTPFRDRSSLQGVLAAEKARLLREQIDGLPPQMRRCLLLRVDQDLRYREIADLLQISIDTVKSQLFQARERLKGQLATHFEMDL